MEDATKPPPTILGPQMWLGFVVFPASVWRISDNFGLFHLFFETCVPCWQVRHDIFQDNAAVIQNTYTWMKCIIFLPWHDASLDQRLAKYRQWLKRYVVRHGERAVYPSIMHWFVCIFSQAHDCPTHGTHPALAVVRVPVASFCYSSAKKSDYPTELYPLSP